MMYITLTLKTKIHNHQVLHTVSIFSRRVNESEKLFKDSLGFPSNPLNPSNPPNLLNPSNRPNLPSPLSPSHPSNPCPHPPNPRFKDSLTNELRKAIMKRS